VADFIINCDLMPIRSQAQRAFLHIHHPKIAKRWEKETPKGKLPKHVEKEECADMTTTEKREKDTPRKLRWDFIKHGIGSPGMTEAVKKKDLPSYSEVMEKFSELEMKFGSGYREIAGEGPGPGGFGVVGCEEGYPFAESEIGEEGPPKEKKIKEGRVDEAQVDFASMKDPAKFIDGIDDYMNGFKKDIDVLQAFAKSHAQKAPSEKKPALDSLANNLSMVKKTSDPLIKRVGQAIDQARATAAASPAGGNPAAKPAAPPAASGKSDDMSKTNPDAMRKTSPGMGFEPKKSAAGHVWSKTNPDMKKTNPGAGKPSDKKPERGMRQPLTRQAVTDPKHMAPKGARADWEKQKMARQFRA
jgi:hypothetical protein